MPRRRVYSSQQIVNAFEADRLVRHDFGHVVGAWKMSG